ncbi:hypothetical protein CDV55_102399 [Aspergillus turcosus]|nr:hypothetical protein CDV55_102399 [Aspergillus turcosus]
MTESLLDIAKAMQSSLQGITSNQNMEIYCSDLWLVSEDPDGDISYSISKWVSMYQAGQTMTVASQQRYESGVANLDQFSGLTMSTALMHELTHAPAIVGPNYLNDGSCQVAGVTKSAYGWACITQLAATPSSALNNADSFAYYIAAMYLSLNNWSTGESVPIPPDTTPDYDDGLASMMSKLTLS